jgi:hypothetical protein
VLPQAAERILSTVADGEAVLQVGPPAGGAFGRSDWVLADGAYEPDGEARFTRRTWVSRDVCAREPWPFADGRFAFAVCTTLAGLRDPIGVCAELSRVARAGYVEVPAIEAELAGGEARWLCEVVDAELVFTHKPASLHGDPRVRVPARWSARLEASDRVHGIFWDDRLPARERMADTEALATELADRLRRRFEPSSAEVALVEARRLGGLAGQAARRRVEDLRGGR